MLNDKKGVDGAQIAKPRERRCLSRGSKPLPGARDHGSEGPHRLLVRAR